MPRYVALDLEFVKRAGHPYARSAAFVPFVPQRPPSGGGGGRATLTVFHEPPTVLALSVPTIMASAEVLPCGHCLAERVRSGVVAGDALEAIRAPFVLSVEQEWQAFRQKGTGRREAREAERLLAKAQSTKEGEEEPQQRPATGGGPPSRAEVLEKARLQKTLALVSHVKGFDPFSIPNTRVVPCDALRALYAAPPGSPDYTTAYERLQPLRAYGNGKGPLKAPLTLARHHPALLQAMLRASFASADAWVDWLSGCAACAEQELELVSSRHRSSGSGSGSQGLRFVELETPEELSRALNTFWAGLLYDSASTSKAPRGGRFSSLRVMAYGNADSGVLHTTLYSSCREFTQEGRSARAAQAGGWIRGEGVASVPTQRLLSPFQAKVFDVTSHALFAASGFKGAEGKKPPSLSAALHIAASRDATAAALEADARPHDPLWDAQALACICVVSGIATA